MKLFKIKNNKLVLYLIAIFLFIVIILSMNQTNENMQNINLDIGNTLSFYYCTLINAMVLEQDFHIEENKSYYQYNRTNSDDYTNEVNFINYLPKDIPFSSIEPYSRLIREAGVNELQTCKCSFYRFDDNIVKYKVVPILKPLIQKLFDEALQRSGLDSSIVRLNHPVIHFRCSDTPFVRNEEYKLQRYSYFKTCLENSGYLSGPVTILWYGGHRSGKKESKTCGHYANQLKDYLESLGYEVDIQSHSNVEDFAKIFYAPLTISTGGSFSMFAGLFGYGDFYQPRMFDMPVGISAHWLYGGYNIDHTDVKDYYDVSTIFNMLNE